MNFPLDAVTLMEKKPPEAEDVVAGWLGFAVFIGLIVAVALLCWSFARQVRKTRAARDAGVFGPVAPDEPDETDGTVESTDHEDSRED